MIISFFDLNIVKSMVSAEEKGKLCSEQQSILLEK